MADKYIGIQAQQDRRQRYTEMILKKIGEIVEGPGGIRNEFEETPSAFTDFILALSTRVPVAIAGGHDDSVDFLHNMHRLLITEAIDLEVHKAVKNLQEGGDLSEAPVSMNIVRDESTEPDTATARAED